MTEASTFPSLLLRNRLAAGSRPVVVSEDASITHAQLDDWSRVLAGRLVAAGVSKSSRIGLLAPNGVEWAMIAAAAMRIGAVLVPLSTLLKPPELRAQLTSAAVTHLIAAKEFRGRRYLDELESVPPSVRHIWPLDELPTAAVSEGLVEALEGVVRPADDLVILFTSGSRGAPKGVIHTHGGALRAVAAGLESRCVAADERLYIPMPFFWTGGFSGGLMTAIVACATLLTEATPSPESTLALLKRESVTLFRGWPDQAVRLAADPRFRASDLSSLRPGSLPAVLPPDQRSRPGSRANLFGMTETFGPYCGAPADTDLPPGKFGSCGMPFEGVEVRIVDPETTQPCPPGATGEIWVRGPNVMRGMCGRTREQVFTRDGFYRTSDLGALDAEGYLWYSGRLDDMFKVSGATVFPSEVEAALRGIDGVRAAYVTDVPGADSVVQVGALVVSSEPLEQVASEARERLSAFKVPKLWLLGEVADVPVTATSKVDKSALQELLRLKGIQSR